jgi:hypothetical protein
LCRKAAAHWQHKCHVRRLHTVLVLTQPHRELALVRSK